MFSKKLFSKIVMMFMAVLMGIQMFSSTAFAINNTDKGSILVNNVEEGVDVWTYRLMDINFDYAVQQPKNPMYKWVSEVTGWMSTNYPDFIDEENLNAVNEKFSNASEQEVAVLYDKLAVAIKSGEVNLSGKEVKATADTVRINNLTMGNYFILVEGGVKVYRPLTANVVPEWTDNAWKMSEPVVYAKASEPSITKTVTDGLLKDNADIGDTLTFELNVVMPVYPENATAKRFAVSDRLSDSLTLKNDSIKVYGVNTGKNDEILNSGYTKVFERPVADKEASFVLDFDYNAVKSYEALKITYDVVLNENAVIGEEGNKNNAFLDYNNNPYVSSSWNTDEDKNIIYTYGMKVFKVDENDENMKLSGAVFSLMKDDKEIRFSGINGVYRVCESQEEGSTEVEVHKDGSLVLDGLDAGTYYLTEVKAPDGYVKLQNPIKVVITDEDVDGTVEIDNKELDDAYVPVTVKNDKGFTLPVTGGMGTTLFTLTGVILMSGGILLIVMYLKRRNYK